MEVVVDVMLSCYGKDATGMRARDGQRGRCFGFVMAGGGDWWTPLLDKWSSLSLCAVDGRALFQPKHLSC